MGSIIVSVESNKAGALHIKWNWFWKPVNFDQKFGWRLHETTLRKPSEVSLLSFHFASSWETSTSRKLNFWILNENAMILKCTNCLGEKPQQTTKVDTNWKWTEQERVLMGLLCQSYQLHSALSEIVSLICWRGGGNSSTFLKTWRVGTYSRWVHSWGWVCNQINILITLFFS